MAVGRWLYDNPHKLTHYTLTNAVAAVYKIWLLGFQIYDWQRRLSHMQMTDSDFIVNDWRRRRRRLLIEQLDCCKLLDVIFLILQWTRVGLSSSSYHSVHIACTYSKTSASARCSTISYCLCCIYFTSFVCPSCMGRVLLRGTRQQN